MSDFRNRALYALQGVLIDLRSIACQEGDYAILADGLDVAEHLVRLIARQDESEFRNHLEELSERHGFSGSDRFDREPTPSRW